MVDIYEWIFTDGSVLGCGTKAELEHWQQEGIVDPLVTIGRKIASENASEDDRRATCWGLADFLDTVAA